MTTAAALSADELVFAQRMLPHFLAGKPVYEAAKAVLEDDARLFEALFDRSHSYFVPTADERGTACSAREGKGDVIAREITAEVYSRLRA